MQEWLLFLCCLLGSAPYTQYSDTNKGIEDVRFRYYYYHHVLISFFPFVLRTLKRKVHPILYQRRREYIYNFFNDFLINNEFKSSGPSTVLRNLELEWNIWVNFIFSILSFSYNTDCGNTTSFFTTLLLIRIFHIH